MRIDSHQHFWRYTPEDYPWIAPEWQVLRRDFLPDDLSPLLAAHRLDGAIAVQAQQTIDETRWLLDLAADHPDTIKGVVGWVPLIDSDVNDAIEQLVASPTGTALKGIRHILQGEADDAYMLREDFNRGVARLRAHGLTYDILIFGRHLANAAAFVDRHPDQVFVLDHIAKPEILADRSSTAQPSGLAAPSAPALAMPLADRSSAQPSGLAAPSASALAMPLADRSSAQPSGLAAPSASALAMPLADRSSAQPSELAAPSASALAMRAAAFDRAWADGLRELARRPHVMCKLSGVVTETRDAEWTPALIAPYLDTALDAFGPDRILFGTDWPVCLLRCEYQAWVETVTSFISTLTPAEQDAIMGGTAARAYRL